MQKFQIGLRLSISANKQITELVTVYNYFKFLIVNSDELFGCIRRVTRSMTIYVGITEYQACANRTQTEAKVQHGGHRVVRACDNGSHAPLYRQLHRTGLQYQLNPRNLRDYSYSDTCWLTIQPTILAE